LGLRREYCGMVEKILKKDDLFSDKGKLNLLRIYLYFFEEKERNIEKEFLVDFRDRLK
jgi:hypothetical protein